MALMLPLAEYTLFYEQQKRLLSQASQMRDFTQWLARQTKSAVLNGLSFNDLIIMSAPRRSPPGPSSASCATPSS